MITLLLLPLIPLVAATEAVWVEGESDTIASTYNQHNWYSDVDETLLSPGFPGNLRVVGRRTLPTTTSRSKPAGPSTSPRRARTPSGRA